LKVVKSVPRRALPIHLFRHISYAQCHRRMDRQTVITITITITNL